MSQSDLQLGFAVRMSRSIGAQVCKIRGHRYYSPTGCFEGNSPYFCCRCKEADRPWKPEDLEGDPLESWEEFEAHWRKYEHFCRWFSRLPFPIWL
jgi:hypothetical protein